MSLALVLAGLNACKKEITPDLPAGIQNNQSANDRSEVINFDPISLQALNHTSNEDYEFAGRTLFEHAMYFPDTDVKEYFPAELSMAIDPYMAKFKRDYLPLKTQQQIVYQMVQDSVPNAQAYMAHISKFSDSVTTQLNIEDTESFTFGKAYNMFLNKG